MRRYLVPLTIAAGGAAALAYFGREEFQGEAIIPAPAEDVYAVLTNPATYPHWNPVFVQVRGRFRPGEDVTTTVRFPDKDVDLDGTVTAMVPNRLIRQQGGWPGFVTFDHRWILEPVAGGTRVIQHETDRGLYLWFWDSSWVGPAYQRAVDRLASYMTGG